MVESLEQELIGLDCTLSEKEGFQLDCRVPNMGVKAEGHPTQEGADYYKGL